MSSLLRLAILNSVICGVCCTWCAPAWAYSANVGDRAANFKGFDIVNREVIELDDYLGQWVLVDHWATWCGPCVRELPNMLEQTRPYVDDGRLKVITVSADTAESLPKLKRLIRQHRLTYPVIYDGGSDDPDNELPIPAVEWNIRGWPSTFLIDPQGVIVANEVRGDMLAQVLDFYLNGEPPVIGLRANAKANADRSISVVAEVMCSTHEPVEIRARYYCADWIWDEDFVVIDEQTDSGELGAPVTVTFGDFGEATFEFSLPPDDALDYYCFWVEATVPGSGHIVEDDRAGVTFEVRTNDVMLVEDFYYDEEIDDYRVVP